MPRLRLDNLNDPDAVRLLARLAPWRSQIELWLRTGFPILDAADREDCWQRMSIACWQDFEFVRQLDPATTLLPWLRVVSKHIAMNMVRARRRRRKKESAAARPLAVVGDVPLDPEERPIVVPWDASVAECPDGLRDRLNRLTARQVEMLRLRYWKSKTHAEIAENYGISTAAVASQLARILNKLRPPPGKSSEKSENK